MNTAIKPKALLPVDVIENDSISRSQFFLVEKSTRHTTRGCITLAFSKFETCIA